MPVGSGLRKGELISIKQRCNSSLQWKVKKDRTVKPHNFQQCESPFKSCRHVCTWFQHWSINTRVPAVDVLLGSVQGAGSFCIPCLLGSSPVVPQNTGQFF